MTKGTPVSSQVIWMEQRIAELEEQVFNLDQAVEAHKLMLDSLVEVIAARTTSLSYYEAQCQALAARLEEYEND